MFATFLEEYYCISLSFQKKKCFLRWNEEWSQRNDEWQEHLEKPHCCKEKDNIFVQSFYLCLWCFCVQFNVAKLFELKPITIIFLNTKFDVSEARTWKGMGFRSQKFNKICKLIKKLKILICGFQRHCLNFFRNFKFKNMHRVKSSYMKT